MKKQGGFGTLELLVVLAVMVIGLVAMLGFNLQMVRLQAQNADLIELQMYSQGLVAMVSDNNAWATRIRPANAASMACLPGGCLPGGAPPPVWATYDIKGNLLAGAEQPLAVLDAQGNVLFDPHIATNGITMNGTKCTSYPSYECPATYKINWYPTTAKAEPILVITIRLIVHPDYAKTTIDTTRFSFDSSPGQPNPPPVIYRSSL